MQEVFCLLAIHLRVAQVSKNQVHVGAAGENVNACCLCLRSGQALSKNLRAFQSADLTVTEFFGSSNLHGNSFRCNHVHQRTTLLAWEDCRVELLSVVLLSQDHAGARTAQGLVHGGGNNVRVWNWIWVQISCNETSKVCHIGPQVSPHFICDGTVCFKIQSAWVGRPASDDDLWLFCNSLLTQLVHVDTVGFCIDFVGSYFVELAGEVQLHAVGQVTTVSQRKAQDLITWVDKRSKDGSVCLCTGVWLYVGKLSAEQSLSAVTRQIFDDIDVLTSTVVAATWVALCVLVGKDGTLCLQDCTRNKVLRRNHLQGIALTSNFTVNCCIDLWV